MNSSAMNLSASRSAASSPDTGLQVASLRFAYNGTPVLLDINLSITEGEFVCLLGPSGCGKTTLLRLLAGLETPSSGNMSWKGRRIEGPSLERGVVCQDYSLFPWMSLVNNITLALTKSHPGTDKKWRLNLAKEFLDMVGLADAARKHPSELSGGMQQRGAIARTLALGSPVLLMDEPFGALDPVNRAKLQDLVLELCSNANSRKTVVFVTHDIEEALFLADRVVMLGSSPGRIIEEMRVPLGRPRLRRTLPAEWLLAGAGSVFTGTLATVALTRSVPLIVFFLIAAGFAWTITTSTLNTAVQLSVPDWVQARALGIYQMVFAGGMAGGCGRLRGIGDPDLDGAAAQWMGRRTDGCSRQEPLGEARDTWPHEPSGHDQPDCHLRPRPPAEGAQSHGHPEPLAAQPQELRDGEDETVDPEGRRCDHGRQAESGEPLTAAAQERGADDRGGQWNKDEFGQPPAQTDTVEGRLDLLRALIGGQRPDPIRPHADARQRQSEQDHGRCQGQPTQAESQPRPRPPSRRASVFPPRSRRIQPRGLSARINPLRPPQTMIWN